jgi:hypothetical protein
MFLKKNAKNLRDFYNTNIVPDAGPEVVEGNAVVVRRRR